MKAPLSLLRQRAPDLPAAPDLAELLTAGGLEVDSLEPAAPEFSGVVVAQVQSVQAIEDSRNNLSLCQVQAGDAGSFQIVCGAPVIETGKLYPLAQPGAVLPGDFEIGERKLAGVLSQGMLCSERELGIGEDSDGICRLPDDLAPGTCLRSALALDDVILTLDLTPDRADCFGIEGIARDGAALAGVDFAPLPLVEAAQNSDQQIEVQLPAAAACPHYLARVITGIDQQALSPLWLREHLRRLGLRSISAVVDVTNYVMMELGQPLHAFDRNAIAGGIQVRHAEAGEHLLLLDGTDLPLQPADLLIADESKPLALAGVMGGAASGVGDGTTDIVLESAFFSAAGIAHTARFHDLATDASRRYERGVCPNLQERAMQRATALIVQICGGQAGPISGQRVAEHIPQIDAIELSQERLQALLGAEVKVSELTAGFARLGFAPQQTGTGAKAGWQLSVPSHRFDLQLPEDMVEEAARLIGYDQLPEAAPVTGALQKLATTDSSDLQIAESMRNLLVAEGWTETINYSFVDPKLQWLLLPKSRDKALQLASPLAATQSLMRTSLIPGLLQTLRHNLAHRESRVRIFERGVCFQQKADELAQDDRLSGLLYGPRHNPSWALAQPGESDFFDAKGTVEHLMTNIGLHLRAIPPTGKDPDWMQDWFAGADEAAALHPGKTAVLQVKPRAAETTQAAENANWQTIGLLACLHPSVASEFGAVSDEVVIFEIDLPSLPAEVLPTPKFQHFERFPRIRRDLSLLVPETVKAADLLQTITQAGGAQLVSCSIFDLHELSAEEAAAHPEASRALAVALEWQPDDGTWTTERSNQAVTTILHKLQKIKVSLRTA